MKKRLQALCRQKDGMAMVTMLCAAAVFLALAAALLYSASVLAATANRQLRHERCYQLAKTFSEVLEQDLCVAEPPSEDSKSVYNYANRFLDDLYNIYDPDNINNTTYSYSTTVGGNTREEYSTISVTLFKEETDADADSVKNITQDFHLVDGVTSPSTAQELTEFENRRINDYRFSMQVTAAFSDDSYRYAQRYYRMVQYSPQYKWNGMIIYRAENNQWSYTPDGGQLIVFPQGDTLVVGSYNTTKVLSRIFLREGE